MGWEKIRYPSDKEIKEFEKTFEQENGFKFIRKPRYFVDENLGQGVTDLIRYLGGNVTDPWEQGMLGYKDDRVWRFAREERRIILSHDDDFMDESKYPIRECYGYILLPHKEGGESPLTQKIVQMYNIISSGAGFLYRKKLIIRENGHWELHSISETGKIIKTLYDLNDRNHVYELN
ncbi:DUF5615 family PIN-like protein [Sulfurimonas sp. HSL-3221]|uniref:DUF5615 family PIN-like protein n=1 Tax=Sulfurimonadaceae TaxID=2771471 RepID=UPI001E630AA7|nr:DUF5615 family PIN-like protein [Sulfurimonas sp. HSL-3221]UFS62546.1 DUF5615 family PIN-like protein [Sulfurimonas sp. HSL-3221]